MQKAIEKAYSFDELQAGQQQAEANLEQQIAGWERAIALEKDKKKTDGAKIKEYQDNIDKLKEQQAELKQSNLEMLGGIGENVNTAAQEFIDAWYEAFKETGDGLSALEGKWDDYINNIIKKQLMLRYTENYLKPLFTAIDNMFAKDSEAGTKVTKNELDKTNALAKEKLPALNEALKDFADSIGYTVDSASEMSGLQKGISGVTEDTAQALEALISSMRFFVADSNKQLQGLYKAFTSTDNNYNPILGELRLQTEQISAINRLLASTLKAGHPSGGSGIKVFLN